MAAPLTPKRFATGATTAKSERSRSRWRSGYFAGQDGAAEAYGAETISAGRGSSQLQSASGPQPHPSAVA